MVDYIKERQTIANPLLCNQSFPFRPNLSHFSNLCKVTTKRKRTIKATPRKIRKNYILNKRAAFPQPKGKQTKATFTITAPVTATPAMVIVTPNLPTIPNLPVSTERSAYCVMCLALGKPCPMFTLSVPAVSLPHSDWSDCDVEEDWDGQMQKES